MQIDLDYLRRHYASLSDDALREIDATELVDAARKIYDEELAQRKLAPIAKEGEEANEESVDEEPGEEVDSGDEPDWLTEAAVAATFISRSGSDATPYVEAREVLEAAEIPCHVSIGTAEPSRSSAQREFRLMVPASRNLEAQSVLDKEVFNREVEVEWRAHFQILSDEELREVDLQALLGGLMDRIQRITNAYNEELAQRESG